MSDSPPKKLDLQELRNGLKKVGFRGFAALQQQMDVTLFFQSSAMLANEKDFGELRSEARFAASESTALTFERAKFESQRWFLKNSLLECLRIVAVVLEDTRTICALSAHLDKSGEELKTVSREITGKGRQAFSKLALDGQLQALEKEFGVTTPHAESLLSVVALAKCLALRSGVVGKADCGEGDSLIVKMHGLQIRPGEASASASEAGVKLQATATTKAIGIGQPVDLSRQEVLAIMLSHCLFLSSLLQSADTHLAKLAGTPKKAAGKSSK